MTAPTNPTQRFSKRVDNYVKHRPHYPRAVLELLQAQWGLTPAWTLADIGSGTGFSAEMFLANGNRVYGIEPNAPMRAAGEVYLVSFPNFVSVDGTAEATTLPEASVDMVLAGQAFHWFDQGRARAEFERILRAGRWLVLMWNSRDEDSPFQRDYEQMLLQLGTDYADIRHTNIADEEIERFFGPEGCRKATFPNRQMVDFEGLVGRVSSSSYVPSPGDPGYEPMVAELRRLFDKHQVQGQLSFDYFTEVFYGRLT